MSVENPRPKEREIIERIIERLAPANNTTSETQETVQKNDDNPGSGFKPLPLPTVQKPIVNSEKQAE